MPLRVSETLKIERVSSSHCPRRRARIREPRSSSKSWIPKIPPPPPATAVVVDAVVVDAVVVDAVVVDAVVVDAVVVDAVVVDGVVVDGVVVDGAAVTMTEKLPVPCKPFLSVTVTVTVVEPV
jgi:hypothetical protein